MSRYVYVGVTLRYVYIDMIYGNIQFPIYGFTIIYDILTTNIEGRCVNKLPTRLMGT